ncbi:MAG: hypothetical protein NVS9B15_04770 [Acidobacteriaceae bacterium]
MPDVTSNIPSAPVRDMVTRLAALPPELTLGSLCWYSMGSDLRVEHSDFLARMMAVGLDARAPLYPEGTDIFRRALKENERTRVINDDGSTSNYMVRPWSNDADQITYQLVCEKVDSARTDKLRYVVLADIKYDKTTEAIATQHTGDPVFESISTEVGSRVQNYYNFWRGHLPDQPIRQLVRSCLDGWNATAVRASGGIYFVAQDEHENLEKLETLINSLPRCSFHVLPLIDDRKQREMLKQAFEDESIGEVDKLIGDIQDVLADPEKRITENAAMKVQERFYKLMGKTANYSDLLDEAMEMTAARLEVLQGTVQELFQRIR